MAQGAKSAANSVIQMCSVHQPSVPTDLRLLVEASPRPTPAIISSEVGKIAQLLTARTAALHPRNHSSEGVLPMADRDHRTINPQIFEQVTKSTLRSLHGSPRPLGRLRSQSLIRRLNITVASRSARRTL